MIKSNINNLSNSRIQGMLEDNTKDINELPLVNHTRVSDELIRSKLKTNDQILNSEEIDKEVKQLLVYLQSYGFSTLDSCSGHNERLGGIMMIGDTITEDSLIELSEILWESRSGDLIDKKCNLYYMYNSMYHRFIWTLVFSTKDIPVLEEILDILTGSFSASIVRFKEDK